MEIDPREFRRCLGRFTTGVTVVTYRSAEGIRGATVNSFTSVSLEPRLVLVSLARRAQASNAMDGVPFAINVLRSDQTDLAYQFAGRPQSGLRIDWQSGADDVPTLPGAIAVLTCRPWRRYDGGDHILQLGEVIDAHTRPGDPLVFSDGQFTTTGLPVLDGPLVLSLDAPPAPSWTAAASRLQYHAEAS
ncbi:flavin reductase family protein [Saccharopolyspora sp. NPDC049357]|uniref:flavin reductase family protein n=1 Tax=Saccharopolyspora sp. NPDC049357 TaxID=3154507 RepID=UPI003449A9FC